VSVAFGARRIPDFLFRERRIVIIDWWLGFFTASSCKSDLMKVVVNALWVLVTHDVWYRV
jgi:hypothetical protein